MCAIILPIHPRYVEKILSGEKKVEYRKTRLKRKPDKIIIYATAPISKIVAEVQIENILEMKINELWKLTKKISGIEKSFFTKYYDSKTIGIAYSLGEVTEYTIEKDISEYGLKAAPQSAVYWK